ncbi:metallophosphoesterase family protein [Caulobacter sp. S45]|jgi:serine/threonine protein phosphatase 1|uniref:metallophosphoesterase family protein n=1 Tax=Caulobacter sp. S45 TaxID=1641861 RepID=UPI00131BA6EB|nr:metallophosphoesterase family protein [Caulobacter sp. S45]
MILLGRAKLSQGAARPPRHDWPRSKRLVYAIGDIHGRLDLLQAIVEKIRVDATSLQRRGKATLIFLGDYIDRGPDSKGVLDYVTHLQDRSEFKVITLKGNHEQGLNQFLADPAFGPKWAKRGGNATLLSYGLTNPSEESPAQEWVSTRDCLEKSMPRSHRYFLEDLDLSATIDDYFFVHAGVRCSVALNKQVERDMLWIRGDFLESSEILGKVIVHGHTPAPDVELMGRRIGVDTGAYVTGKLSAVRLLGHTQCVIQVHLDTPARTSL